MNNAPSFGARCQQQSKGQFWKYSVPEPARQSWITSSLT